MLIKYLLAFVTAGLINPGLAIPNAIRPAPISPAAQAHAFPVARILNAEGMAQGHRNVTGPRRAGMIRGYRTIAGWNAVAVVSASRIRLLLAPAPMSALVPTAYSAMMLLAIVVIRQTMERTASGFVFRF
ncbi:hypothetical protein PT974_04491 [Cladobotryum mycophilum]|uniref:Uncharacterized protein n=1 Tax=Cladobotryum mycophilum TaxID=491253 RepID=A0ABR0SVM9_9HYPO